jgi:hypothetical protein
MIERIPEPCELFEQHDRELEQRHQAELKSRHQLHKRQGKNYTFEEYLSEAERLREKEII